MILNLSDMPERWFLHSLREARAPITYVGDWHVPLGYWVCELQHELGGRMVEGRGNSPQAAFNAAVSDIYSKMRDPEMNYRKQEKDDWYRVKNNARNKDILPNEKNYGH